MLCFYPIFAAIDLDSFNNVILVFNSIFLTLFDQMSLLYKCVFRPLHFSHSYKIFLFLQLFHPLTLLTNLD